MASDPPAIEGIRGILVYAGLGTPVARAFVTGVTVGLGAYMLRMPAACYDQDGQMRPFKPLSSAPTATNYHFLAVPLAAATTAYLFT